MSEKVAEEGRKESVESVEFVEFVFPPRVDVSKTLVGFEVKLRDLQFLDPEIKSRWWNVKLGCSSVGTVNSASTFL